MYENSVVALHKILESPITTGNRSVHSSDFSCKISTIPPQITYLENGIKYYCIEVICEDGKEFAIQEYGDEAETLFREAHKCIFCPLTSYLSELESLGVKPKHINELNDNYEMENLVNNIKQSFFQNYKSSNVHSLFF